MTRVQEHFFLIVQQGIFKSRDQLVAMVFCHLNGLTSLALDWIEGRV